jgi:hypothetical protein
LLPHHQFGAFLFIWLNVSGGISADKNIIYHPAQNRLPAMGNLFLVSRDIYELYEQRRHENRWPFQSLYKNKELFVQIVKHFPYPMHICAPDGTLLLANEAFLKEITRQEMLTLLCNTLRTIGRLPEGTVGKPLSAFTDADGIASWAREAIALLVETGIISGNEGKLSPTSTTTRAEMAQVLYNLLSKIVW